MYKRFLCIGGEQDGHFVKVKETEQSIKLRVSAKIDFTKLSRIVTLDSGVVRVEKYNRKKIGKTEYFCLEGISDNEIFAKLPK